MTVKIIAEIGCNHKGDIKIAQDLIKAAKRCGADVAKFQKRNNKLLLNKKEYESPHPEPWNSYGNTYGLHREALEFNIDQHKELQDFCSHHWHRIYVLLFGRWTPQKKYLNSIRYL